MPLNKHFAYSLSFFTLVKMPISDIEPILDEIVFLKDGKVVRQGNVDDIRYESGESIDQLFRHEFKA